MADRPPVIPPGQTLPPMLTQAERTRQSVKADDTPKGQAKHRGRFGVLNAFADYGARLVDPTAQACWWIVFRETKPDGLARVSQGHVGECIGRSRWTVSRAIRQLEAAGLLTVVRQGGLHGGASTYRVHGVP